MRLSRHPAAARERGMVLIASLLLLLVVTLLAVAMFRSMGLDAKIAGNVREKQRALHAAESAQQYAEWWLTTNGNSTQSPVGCNAVLSANLGQGQICNNTLQALNVNPAIVPWQISGSPVGVTYVPTGMNATGVTAAGLSAANTYATSPVFYIGIMGPAADGQGIVYQIDAVGYGGTQNTVAIVESTYEVGSGVTNRGGL
ncbi:MAG TPA: PilX N-terminal domain-containing pilus assembly protein [Steroidobacteraceae bacterium]|jgi:type IV pilus assembly protein PilX|nr:PilX N-terminal domain-containing pilus assembly protein [Steroidobacteraceae bacterium]